MNNKSILRRNFAELRENIQCRFEKESAAIEKIISLPRVINADTILLYASIGSEFGTSALANRLIESNIPIAFPKCSADGIITFHCVNSLGELKPGRFNIPEPPTSENIPLLTEKTVCIVPALAFSENGCRLGYGGGFYDRFLSADPQVYSIGINFDELIVKELPFEDHDIRVNSILTDKRMVLCSAE